ncbi:MAG TPA: 4-(cytidine 5'-diphospho)-2-C-methyl-D-erythritol kinase [Pirellulales bacterium]|nr:4-(cytidine 5'-diphospho)-2-C-methyl-D-erythritol kinase [Pirellulales bacterium]
MHIHRSMSGVEVWAPAKLNLFLEVLAKRTDGYHEIETLMVPVDWYDTLRLSACSSGRVSLTCRLAAGSRVTASADPFELPPAADNLAVRAVELLRQRSGVEQGAQIELTKRIPLASGLAGGSSDAAAALVAANAAWNLGYNGEQLADIGAELGSDVPFFIHGGPAVCRGRGERVEPVRDLAPMHFVVARPPVGLSTPAVYGRCRPADGSPGHGPQRVGPLLDALRIGDLGRAGRLLHNALMQAAEQLSTWIGRLKHEFAAAGCLGHQMSGSGTSYFGLCRHARHAQRLAAALRSRGIAQVQAVAGSY